MWARRPAFEVIPGTPDAHRRVEYQDVPFPSWRSRRKTTLRPSHRSFRAKPETRVLRDRLILTYAPLVKYAAGRPPARASLHVVDEDLVPYGLLGLIGAIERPTSTARSSSRPTRSRTSRARSSTSSGRWTVVPPVRPEPARSSGGFPREPSRTATDRRGDREPGRDHHRRARRQPHRHLLVLDRRASTCN